MLDERYKKNWFLYSILETNLLPIETFHRVSSVVDKKLHVVSLKKNEGYHPICTVCLSDMATNYLEYKGNVLFFCNFECQREFLMYTKKYIGYKVSRRKVKLTKWGYATLIMVPLLSACFAAFLSRWA